ncbi:DEAD/DEAH box helicase [Kitasatospora kifunensis]|uniref:Non-specific serine/threonine protein kinase n=1 Tax=Kitasatospora kifunensis TaxID=58351 RepID=A0A7W7R3Y0_KITKI|nr:DEAD/DEAH box helicase [Kitasatospora kifunensis]MBB4924985.1 non-specific serine/threonine protein kinase [Kitasatospora kifunensis]
MFAVHGLWRGQGGGRLALWAEDARAMGTPGGRSAAGGRSTADGRSTAGGRAEVRPHPYACSALLLGQLLAGIGPGLAWLAGRAAERWATLSLPSLSGAPTPSPELLGALAPSGVSLHAWRVPTLVFEPEEAAQLLGELFDPRWALTSAELDGIGQVDVGYGASLRWLTGVHDLAWRLAGQGRVLPALVREPEAGRAAGAGGAVGTGRAAQAGGSGTVAYARWQPVLSAADRREARALAEGCPPVARGDRSGTVLLTEVLETLTDREVRATLADHAGVLRLPRGVAAADLDGRVTERWFAALGAGDGRVELGAAEPVGPAGTGNLADLVDPGGSVDLTDLADPTDPVDPVSAALDRLGDRLAAWHASGGPQAPAVRLCLRLVEPLGPDPDDPAGGSSDDHWWVEFLLQAVDEPSLLVTAAELLAGGAALAAFERTVEDPQGAYLDELDRAVRCRAELRPALRSARPSGLPLDRDGALDFLREAAPVLAEAGFGVLLPSWWQRRPRLAMALSVRAAEESAGRSAAGPPPPDGHTWLNRDAVVAFRWQAALDGRPLTAQELADLAAAKRGLVRVRGQWIEVDARQIAAAVDFLAREGSGESAPGRLLKVVLEPGALVAGLPIGAINATGALGALLDVDGRPQGERPGVRLPADFGTTLRPYQERGVAWLHSLSRLGLGAVLADDMGLGKTVQTLALLAAERGQASGGVTLLVCPTSLVANWRREAARFAPMLRVHVQHGAARPGGAELRAAVAGADLVITTYGVVQRDAPELRAIRWRRVIADEAQNIKNSATAQSRALRSVPAEHRIALTGTPVENRLSELHAILDFANPGLLGSAAAFKERYAIPVEQHANTERTAELLRRTSPFILRRRKDDPAVAVALPAKEEMTVWCGLTAEQTGLYQAVVADLLHRLRGKKGVERKGAVLGAIGKLKQVCNHPAQLLHDGSAVAGRSGKLARLEEVLAEALAEGDRALVFTQYAEFGSLLHRHLAERLGTEVLYLHGRLAARRRDELVQRFQQSTGPDAPGVFLLSLKAGGTGLNLTAANQVIHLDRWWNPAVEQQATDRAHRIGQHRTVQVRRFVCAGTVEERIAGLIESKRALAQTVVGEGERWLTELSDGELRELLTLSQEAITE